MYFSVLFVPKSSLLNSFIYSRLISLKRPVPSDKLPVARLNENFSVVDFPKLFLNVPNCSQKGRLIPFSYLVSLTYFGGLVPVSKCTFLYSLIPNLHF